MSQGLPLHPTESFIRRNPHLYGSKTASPRVSKIFDTSTRRLTDSTERKPSEMNSTEKRFLDHLTIEKMEGIWTEVHFQPITFHLARDCKYTPDFMTKDNEGRFTFWDTKGTKKNGKAFYRDDAIVKMKVAARTFPFFRFVMAWNAGGVWVQRIIEP